MNPDDYTPQTWHYPEWEGEIQTTDGKWWYVIVTVTSEKEPGGKRMYFIPSHEAQIFTDTGEEYAIDSLSGEALNDWLVQYGEEVANMVSEKIDDEEINRHEEMCWGD